MFDPHSDEEGFFGWAGDRIERLGLISFADCRGGEECTENHGAMESIAENDDDEVDRMLSKPRQPHREESSVTRWVGAILTHLLALAVGLLIAWYIFPRVLVVPVDPRTGNPLIELPSDTKSSTPPQTPAGTSPSTTNSPDASHQPDPQKKGDNVQPK